jgi:hypothetical protein
MEKSIETLLQNAYKYFNSRDIDAALQLMTPDVHWPNGWEGGYLKGHKEVRDYWTRQWKEIDPTVIPVAFNELNDGVVEVEVMQTVKDIQGKLLFEGKVSHIYTIENDLIKDMKIASEAE